MSKLFPVLPLVIACSFTPREELPCQLVRLFEKSGFPVGTAINTEKLKNEARYWETALAQFNSFTPEKILKPKYIHPEQGKFYFFETDRLMEFCEQRGIRLHGHALVWHEALPRWMADFEGNATDWDALLKQHVQSIVGHCKGRIKSWDVVNEAFNDDGSLRRNVWLKHIGESYIEKAFRYAAEADPGAILFYNDYSLEQNGRKLESVLAFFKDLRSKGVPVHGMGLQMHVSLAFPAIEDINRAAMAVQEAGFLVHYSELDVSLSADQPLFVPGKKLKQQQRARMKDIVSGYMKLAPKSRFGITLWGVSDNDSWLTQESVRARPLLFSMRYKPKPAYCGFLEGLGN